MKVIVSSKNPVKIQAVKEAFEAVFPETPIEFEGVTAKSGVPEQPFGDKETLTGAKTRAANAYKIDPRADYWVGIEGGLDDFESGMVSFSWAVIYDGNKYGFGKTGMYFLPREIANLIKQGKELGEADDTVFGKTDSKQQNGAVGILTHDIITRTLFYKEAVTLALIPFISKEYY